MCSWGVGKRECSVPKNPQRNIIDSSSNLIIFLLFLGGWGREGLDYKCCSISILWNVFIVTFSRMFKFISVYFIGKKQLKFSRGVKKSTKPVCSLLIHSYRFYDSWYQEGFVFLPLTETSTSPSFCSEDVPAVSLAAMSHPSAAEQSF